MNYNKALSLVKKNLSRRKLRTGLSATAFAVAVILGLLLVSIIGGLQLYYNHQLKGVGVNWVEIIPGVIPQFASGGGFLGETGASVYPITIDDAYALKDNATNFSAISPELQTGVYFPSSNSSTFMDGVWPDIKHVFDLTPQSGDFWSTTYHHESGTQIPAVLAYKIWHSSFKDTLKVGDNFTITVSNLASNGTTVASSYVAVAVGFLAEKGTFAGIDFDNALYIPIDAAADITSTGDKIGTIQGVASSSRAINAAATEATNIIKIRHNGQEDFTVVTETELSKQLTDVLAQYSVLVNVVQLFTFVIAGISVFIVMTIAVTERTKEVGILKAIGAKSGDVMKIFMLDTLIISAVGSVIGAAVGFASALLLQRYGGGLFSFIDISSVPVTALETVALIMALGMVFGTYPSYRASKLQPVDALRYE